MASKEAQAATGIQTEELSADRIRAHVLRLLAGYKEAISQTPVINMVGEHDKEFGLGRYLVSRDATVLSFSVISGTGVLKEIVVLTASKSRSVNGVMYSENSPNGFHSNSNNEAAVRGAEGILARLKSKPAIASFT